MRLVIIEDELLATERLTYLMHQYDPNCEIVAALETIEDAVQWFTCNVKPDLILSDIQLADGSAFEIFKKIKISAPVIFTTAYDKYALDAFKVLSIDYLLKPCTLEALTNAMDKLKMLQLQPSKLMVNYDDVIKLLNPVAKTYKTRFTGKMGDKLFIIETHNIALFFSDNKIVFLVTMSNTRYIAEHTLEHLEELLDKVNFFRINRSMIVNISAIGQVRPYDNSRLQIKFKNDLKPLEAIVSRERVIDFRKWANN